MHRAFAARLEFPRYYGYNLDALNACLIDLDIPETGGGIRPQRRTRRGSWPCRSWPRAGNVEPQRQLNKEQIDALRAEMERASLALPKARKLADLPEGRYPITYSADFIMTAFPHVENVREVVKLLVFDAMLRS
jgi:hypothetical protein